MRQRILIVEDDLDTQALLRTLLEIEGFEVTTASNGLEALVAARAERPDLIVLDVMMPLMDGRAFRAAQLLDAELADVPVVLTTASPALWGDNDEVPVAASFAKPIDFECFTRTLREICRKRCAA